MEKTEISIKKVLEEPESVYLIIIVKLFFIHWINAV